MWFNKAKDRDEPNPVDPDYLRELEKYQQETTRVTFDVFALFGIELVDGMPEDDSWLSKLKLNARLGHLDLSTFDLEDEVDREFLFKRYVAEFRSGIIYENIYLP